MVEWKEKQPSKISLLKYADQYELSIDSIISELKILNNKYMPFLDNTGRYIALGKQSGWTEDEDLLEIFIWDVLYCKEPAKIQCSVSRKLGRLKTRIINFGIILAFLNNGIVRIKQEVTIPESLHRSSWEQLGSSMSIKECRSFSLFENGVLKWGPEPHEDPSRTSGIFI